jgi:hypothetical protein
MEEQVVEEPKMKDTLQSFVKLVEDSTSPIYPSCDPENTPQEIMFELLRIKITHNHNPLDTDFVRHGLPSQISSGRQLVAYRYFEANKIV